MGGLLHTHYARPYTKFLTLPSSTPLTDAADLAFQDLGQDLTANLRMQLISSLSSIILAELMEAIGLDGEDAEIVTVVGATVTNHILSNVTHNFLSESGTVDIFDGLNTEALAGAVANALGGYFGAKLGDTIIDPETKEAAIAGSVAAAMGGYIGATLLSAIPVIGTFIGSFLGKLIGNFFGNLFSSDDRHSAYYLTLDETTGDVVLGSSIRRDKADMGLSNTMASNVAAQVNAVMDAADANFDLDFGHEFRDTVIGWRIQSKRQVFYSTNYEPTTWTSLYDTASWSMNIGKKPSSAAVEIAATEAMEQAVSQVLMSNDIVSTDPFKERAFYSSRDESLSQLGFDLQVAEDYGLYVDQQTIINALIAADPTSAFSLGWIATLQRAAELNLNEAGRGDFRAGFRGFLELVDLSSFGATLGDVTVTPESGTLIVDIALRPNAVVPDRIFDLYGGQAAITVINGERVLRIFLDAETLERGEYRGLFMEYAANGEGAGADNAVSGGSIWQARGEQYLKTLWIGSDTKQNDYRDSATYWEFANDDPNTAGSDDILIGGALRDNINGSNGRDWIQGGAGDDALYGDAGDDVLIGGTGNDYLTGGSGQDRFVFQDGFGYDAIADFEVNGGDVIEFGTKDMRSFEEIMGLTQDTEEGAIIIRNPESSILLKGVTKDDLRADHFSLRPAPTVSVADIKILEGSGMKGTGDGFLSTEGNQIVDADGNPFKIAGVNWFGLESEDFVPHGLYDRDWRSMMDQMKTLGFNTIRLPFASETLKSTSRPQGGETGGINLFLNQDFLVSGAYDYRYPIADQQAITALEIMDKIIDYAGEIGLRIILDHHRSEAGISASENGLWYNEEYSEAGWIDDWVMLAERYAGNPTVIGADLHNEPHGKTGENGATWGDGTATDWRAAAERAGNAIGDVNQDWLIFVEGIEEYNGETYWWGGNLMGAADYPVRLNLADKLVYSAHDYPNSVYAQEWFSDPDFPNNLTEKFQKMWGYLFEQGTAPVWLGEIGTQMTDPKDLAWLEKMQAYLKGDFDADGVRELEAGKEGISWTWWSWNPDSGDTGGILMDDWITVHQGKMDAITPVMSPTTGLLTGGTTITFTISLSSAATETITLDYATVADGEAVAGGDFAGISGSVVFLPGEQTKTVTTQIYRDNLDEGDETFSFVLSNAVNAVIGKGVATATIANDDHAGLTGTAAITEDWGSGFISEITLMNSGATLIDDGWTYEFEMPYEITEIWSAEIISHTGMTYVVRNVWYNENIAASQTANFGFKVDAGAADVRSIHVDSSYYQAFGTAAAEVLNGLERPNSLHAGAGDDTLTGWNFADLLDGDAGNDILYANDGDDRLFGGEGDDRLDGGKGADQLFGGIGFDTASYWNSAQAVTVNLATGRGTGGEAEGDILSSIEGVIGSAFADTIIGDDKNNRLEGSAGNDILSGAGGNDVIFGGDGDDTISGDDGDDELHGGSGANTIAGGNGNDLLYGGADNDNLSGGAGDDKLYGNGGWDVLDGGDGDDKLFGESGNDILLGGAGNDKLYGNGGFDHFDGGAGNDEIFGGGQVDVVDGGSGNDALYGNDGDDYLDGGAGDDWLDGGAGNDTLIGGLGNDVIQGGMGNDVIVFRPNFGYDTVLDFVAGAGTDDVLEFANSIFGDFEAVLAAASQQNTDTVIAVDASNSITLKNVALTDLHEDDLRFVA